MLRPLALWCLLGCVMASQAASAQYPKINLAAGYEVDPAWPQKPADIKWRYVTCVAVDAHDRIWMVQQLEPQVQVYSLESKLLKSWGKGQFNMPHFLRIDPAGHVWIADFRRHIIQKFDEDGKLLLVLGTPDVAGNGLVTDGYDNNRIMHDDSRGVFVKTWRQLGVKAGDLSQPHAIAVDSKGLLYVAERNNCRIQIFNQDGKSLGQWRNLVNPWGLLITAKDEVFICGSSPARWTHRGNLGNPPTNQLVMKLDTDGRIQELWTFPLAKGGELVPGELDWIHGMGRDSIGNLYFGDVADESPAHRL